MGDRPNDRLQDRAIRHAIYLDRYASTVTKEVLGYLNTEVYPDLLAKLQARLERIRLRGFDSGFESTKTYLRMLDDLSEILDDGHREAAKRLRAIVRELAKVEARWQEAAILDSVPADARALIAPPERVNLAIVQAIVHRPMQGKVDEEWWGELTTKTRDRLQGQIGLGLSQNETQDQIIRRVRGTAANGYRDGVLEASRVQAAAVVRTTTANVSAQAREETYKSMSGVVKGVQWVATLDTRTCPICGPRDGQVYDLDDPKAPRPPAHWNCRCTTAPVLKSYREIARLKPRAAAEVSEGTRASMDGQVPDAVTWKEWVDKQPAGRQDEIFGASRAKLYRSGRVDAKDLATRTGRIRTVAELERM